MDSDTLNRAYWEAVIDNITHDVLPLAGDKVAGVRERATMQVQIADRIIGCLFAMNAHDNDTPEARLDMVRIALRGIIDGGDAIPLAKAGLDLCEKSQAEREAMRGDAREAEPATAPTCAQVEELAAHLAEADRLNWHEKCGYEEGRTDCDSDSCVAAFYEDHDPEIARAQYRRYARIALRKLGIAIPEDVPQPTLFDDGEPNHG